MFQLSTSVIFRLLSVQKGIKTERSLQKEWCKIIIVTKIIS